MFSLSQNWAENYIGNRLHTDVWQDAVADDKPKAIAMATNMILACFEFNDGVFFTNDDDEDDCYDSVKRGICEQALHLLKLDPTTYPELLTMGLSSGSAGGASASFDKAMIAPFICDTAKRFIGGDGTFIDVSDGSCVISSPMRF